MFAALVLSIAFLDIHYHYFHVHYLVPSMMLNYLLGLYVLITYVLITSVLIYLAFSPSPPHPPSRRLQSISPSPVACHVSAPAESHLGGIPYSGSMLHV